MSQLEPFSMPVSEIDFSVLENCYNDYWDALPKLKEPFVWPKILETFRDEPIPQDAPANSLDAVSESLNMLQLQTHSENETLKSFTEASECQTLKKKCSKKPKDGKVLKKPVMFDEIYKKPLPRRTFVKKRQWTKKLGALVKKGTFKIPLEKKPDDKVLEKKPLENTLCKVPDKIFEKKPLEKQPLKSTLCKVPDEVFEKQSLKNTPCKVSDEILEKQPLKSTLCKVPDEAFEKQPLKSTLCKVPDEVLEKQPLKNTLSTQKSQFKEKFGEILYKKISDLKEHEQFKLSAGPRKKEKEYEKNLTKSSITVFKKPRKQIENAFGKHNEPRETVEEPFSKKECAKNTDVSKDLYDKDFAEDILTAYISDDEMEFYGM